MNVLQLSWDLSMGGTEKTMQIYSKYLHKNKINVSVVGFMNDGPRKDFIENEGIRVYILNGDYEKLKKIVYYNKIDIVHIHRSNNQVLPIIKYLKENTNVKIAETNAFGKITSSIIENYVDIRIFMSMFCAYRFMKERKLSLHSFWKKSRVLYNPLDFDEVYEFNEEEILSYKKLLGIRENDCVIGKYGRKDYYKFGDICIDMMPYLVREVPNLKYLVIGIPDVIKKKIHRYKLEKYFIELNPILDSKDLSLFISSLDILAHSSLIGESFGNVYAEAMAHKKPIVTNATPFFDNAQVEIVENGVNGYIANNPISFSEAIVEILYNKILYKQFKTNNFLKSKRNFDANELTNDLIKMYEYVLFNEPDKLNIVTKEKLDKFLIDYIKIKTKEFKPRIISDYYILDYYFKKRFYSLKEKLLKR